MLLTHLVAALVAELANAIDLFAPAGGVLGDLVVVPSSFDGRILARTGPLDVLALAAQALAMGDDVHVRTQAATNLLIREWLPHLVELGGPDSAAFARFLAGNHLFFLTLGMAAARSLTEWAAQVPDASIVTAMSRNGTTFGVRLAGADRWFAAEAPEVGHALYYPGQGPQTSARDIGDSAVLELCGLGAAAAAGSPAVAQLLGGQMGAAAELTGRLAAVCAGRSSRFKIPVLDNTGTPLGVDVRKVVELGITPAVTTGILHRSDGTGQVGAGVAEAPLSCFADALADLDRRLAGLDRRLAARPPRGPDGPGGQVGHAPERAHGRLGGARAHSNQAAGRERRRPGRERQGLRLNEGSHRPYCPSRQASRQAGFRVP